MSKINIILSVLDIENTVIKNISCQDISLYISIPFCKTRCCYCSFVSHSIDKAGHLIEEYLDVLNSELELLSKLVKKKSLNLKCVYIGGGTPTSLNEEQLFKLLSIVDKNFDLSHVMEYTLEAGRADTITKQKLVCAKKFGVNRISINPQTSNNEILKSLGRNHTWQDVVWAYDLAVDAGFNNINMDIIAGLPNESLESYKNTIDGVLDLAPQSITVHTLSMKKGSKIGQNNKDLQNQYQYVSKMLEYSSYKLSKYGYKPYYLYRQKSILGNLENVGYSKQKYWGIYNIFIMEEVMSILAAGAGGVSKIISSGNKIDRSFNFKYPYEYINDFTKILKILMFYHPIFNLN
jgi:oxygen-independent coproporphyrinogen-3 oxidase